MRMLWPMSAETSGYRTNLVGNTPARAGTFAAIERTAPRVTTGGRQLLSTWVKVDGAGPRTTGMGLDAEEIDTITVDSFTTLVDVRGPTQSVLTDYVADPERVAARWRSRAIAYRMVAAFTDTYEPYLRTTQNALDFALGLDGLDLSTQELEELTAVFERLPVFEDAPGGVQRLTELGYDVYVLSNGEPDLLADIVDRAGIEQAIAGILSAADIQTYKPDPDIYAYAAAETGTPINRIAHLASPWYDIYGAQAAGMSGVWINRSGRRWDAFDGSPDVIVDSLAGVPAAFTT